MPDNETAVTKTATHQYQSILQTATMAENEATTEPLREPLLSEATSGDTTLYEDAQQQPQLEEPQETLSSSDRQGTISSACFNMWSTMVGGGSLSLPLAFAKTGNVFLGPLLLLLTALVTHYCFRVIIDASRWILEVHPKTSYEHIFATAFGKKAYTFGTTLVTLMCFFGIVGYAVLLRDLLEPIAPKGDDWLHRNSVMFAVVLAVTPLCTLKTLTALEKFGAASMASILLLGSCIVFRSAQCTLHHPHGGFRLFPEKGKDVLDVIPLFISCYVCHYNLPPVFQELREPTKERVKSWLSITVFGSTGFYLILGIAGSSYAEACHGNIVDGNILLDFSDRDPLLMVGRWCLSLTITLAFPMLTIPARDILIRLATEKVARTIEMDDEAALDEPFLEPMPEDEPDAVEEGLAPSVTADDEDNSNAGDEGESNTDERAVLVPDADQVERHQEAARTPPSFGKRLLNSVVVFWTGALLASCVASIDIVWDLLGSSLSILLSFLIPCGSFLILASKQHPNEVKLWDQVVAWVMLVVFTPLMFVSTANAIYDTFF